ncbi:putative hydrolase (plasmid) [Selenomonas ruminantium subsp. lactilytica TAM6421]|uniref:Putative hydrolase n=1 Tax=Selenomonas ruminantium subsp. lactilytica (strain NBRC 103574 / TAM6421) TaxID=927704 RepID=I0GVY1_SELRL|nr:gamma-glutamyl-gamma-aminobutyrate hydrolase family protein [Selenomonas ruminantium]BAL84918.1 putative hydrolase [Selenomonas ruminantium subsp. lactilytica TAM6421]
MQKPIIGVVPLVDIGRKSLWMLPGYLDGIRAAGGMPLILPLSTDKEEILQAAGLCDGILLTGGQDVNPEQYSERKLPSCGECSPQRDRMENILLETALKRNMAVLGICRGLQFLNTFLGGTLYQDLPLQRPSDCLHHMTPPYDRTAHGVSLARTSPLFSLLGETHLGVNSYHHQGIHQLADSLEIMAIADDGLIEAVHYPQRNFVWGVQWHPEFSWFKDQNSQKIFAAFVKASAGYRQREPMQTSHNPRLHCNIDTNYLTLTETSLQT